MNRWFRKIVRQSPELEKASTYGVDVVVSEAPDEDSIPIAAGGTHKGRVRERNEDSFLCDPILGLFAVADGMGGLAAGNVASATAIRAILTLLKSECRSSDDLGSLALRSLEAANAEIGSVVRGRPECRGMGSTGVVGIWADTRLYLANSGDSRAYLIRDDRCEMLSKDHSVAAKFVEANQMTADEARKHPLRNHLTAYLGSKEPPEMFGITVDLMGGDRVLLCSDGLWDMVSEQEIVGLVTATADPRQAVRSMISRANAAGGADNITAVAFFVPQTSGAMH